MQDGYGQVLVEIGSEIQNRAGLHALQHAVWSHASALHSGGVRFAHVMPCTAANATCTISQWDLRLARAHFLGCCIAQGRGVCRTSTCILMQRSQKFPEIWKGPLTSTNADRKLPC